MWAIQSGAAIIRRAIDSGVNTMFLLRDLFTTDDPAPMTTPRNCEPGPSTLEIYDAVGDVAIIDGRICFTVGNSTWEGTGAWGPTSNARAVVGAVAGLVRHGVGSIDHGVFLNSAKNPSNINSGGSGIVFDYPNFQIARAISTVTRPGTRVRSIDYLFVIIPRLGGGNWLLVCGGIYGSAFPIAELMWIEATGSEDPIYAGFSHLIANGGNLSTRLDQLTVLKVEAIAVMFTTRFGPALVADTFTRANNTTIGTTEIGATTWSKRLGTASIASNKLSMNNTSIVDLPWVGAQPHIIEATFTTGAGSVEIDFFWRVASPGGNSLELYMRDFNCQLFQNGISLGITGATVFPASSTRRVLIIDDLTNVKVYIDNVLVFDTVTTSTVNTQAGIYNASTNPITVDDYALWPRNLTLPTALAPGPTPPIVGSTTIASDTFTGANGTALITHDAAWIEISAQSYEIQSNKAKKVDVSGGGWVVRDTGIVDHAATVTITIPGSTAFSGGDWYSGCVVRCDGTAGNLVYCRHLYQGDSPEIEVWEIVGGVHQPILGAVNLGAGNLPAGAVRTVALVVKGSEIAVYQDGELILQCTTSLTTGNYAGFGQPSDGEFQPLYDDFTVKTVV